MESARPLKRPLEVNNGNEAMTDTASPFNVPDHREYSTNNTNAAMINAASPFKVPNHRKYPPFSSPKSKPSPFSTIGTRGMNGSPKDGQKRR